MALPGPRTHWRLSEIAEELENLDLSLDMDFSKDMDEFLRGSSLSKDSGTIYSSTDVAGPKKDLKSDNSVGYVDFTKDVPKDQTLEKKKSHYAKCRGRGPVMPKVPPPPPPTQTPPSSGSDKVPVFPPPVPRTPPPPKPQTPPPPVPQTPPTPPPPTPPVPESPAPLPPPVMSPKPQRGGISVLPPLPTAVAPSLNSPVDAPQEPLDDLPPPPIFDLPEPVFAPPSPCTSPLLHNEQPMFRLSRLTSPSPLALSDTTSGYSTSETSTSEVTSSAVSETTSTVYAPTSVASTSSDHPSELSDEVEPVFEKITEEDIQQVEMFYRSHNAQVYVCPGIANLYFGPAGQNGLGEKWDLAQTGIPVLLLDSGDARRERKIQIILAEKGSGFILWKDNIDQLSNFKSVHSNFHSMYLSNDHTKLAGLSYDDENAACDFLTSLHEFTSDPNDEALRMGRNKKKKKVKKMKYKAPKKTDISQPCGFVHVTKLDRNDHEHYVSNVNTPILATRNPNNMSL